MGRRLRLWILAFFRPCLHSRQRGVGSLVVKFEAALAYPSKSEDGHSNTAKLVFPVALRLR